jgi:hypothetical protein
VLLIGAIFSAYGSIAFLVSIPHAAFFPIALAATAVLAGVAVMLNRRWSQYLVYVVSLAYFSVWIWGFLGLNSGGSVRDSTPAVLANLVPGLMLVLVLGLSSLIVGVYFRNGTGDT